MASTKLLFLTCILLLSGLVVLGMAGLVVLGTAAAPEPCQVVCIQGGYITCDNYPYQKLDGCACECAPKDGVNCVLHHLVTGDTFNCPAQAQALARASQG